MNRFLLSSIVLVITAAHTPAQDPAIPAAYQPLATELQGILTGFDAQIQAKWDGSKYPTAFSGELLYANGNNGIQLLTAKNAANVIRELNALHAIGLSAVVVKVGFPLLYQPFLNFNGDPQDYQAFLSFYQTVAQAVHARGMKLIVENTPVFPGFYSQNAGLNVAAYYASLSSAQYDTARATELAIVAAQIQPDYLTIDAEPDTAATLTGQKGSLTPAGWAAQINAAMSMLPASNTVPIGAGCGFWEVSQGVAYIQAIVSSTKVNYVDFHSYQLNSAAGVQEDLIQNAINMTNTALAAGKPVAMSEGWLLKEFDSEYGSTSLASDPTVESRDAWSFWAPLDEQFHTEFYKFSNWKHLLFFSGFWSRYYWSYLDYNQVASLTAPQLVQASETAAAAALASGQVSPLGSFVATLIGNQQGSRAVSGASLLASPAAPGSLVTIFGSALAATTASAPGTPPTALGGVSVMLKDNAGAQQLTQLYYVSPAQINLVLPATGVAIGAATLTTTNGINVPLTIAAVSPGIISANSDGIGVAAAQMLIAHPDGTQSAVTLFQCPAAGACVPVAASLGGAGDQAYLVLYGTGIQNRSSPAGVSVSIGGVKLTPSYAGPQTQYPGLDQVNVIVPASLAGAGVVNVQITVDGVVSNIVTLQIQ